MTNEVRERIGFTALEHVSEERTEQIKLWGNQDHHSNEEFLAILMEEVGEAAQEVNDLRERERDMSASPARVHYESLYEELIQVAAVAVAHAEAVRVFIFQMEN